MTKRNIGPKRGYTRSKRLLSWKRSELKSMTMDHLQHIHQGMGNLLAILPKDTLHKDIQDHHLAILHKVFHRKVIHHKAIHHRATLQGCNQCPLKGILPNTD